MKNLLLALLACSGGVLAANKLVKVKSADGFYNEIRPLACDGTQLTAAIFVNSSQSNSCWREQQKLAQRAARQLPYVTTLLIDTQHKELRQLAHEYDMVDAPGIVLFEGGYPVVKNSLGELCSNSSECRLISDIKISDFVLSEFGDEMRERQIRDCENEGRIRLLREKEPTSYSTGGRYPDWIAAWQPWPLYWG